MLKLPKRTKEQILSDIEAGFKTCRKCLTTKAFDEFYTNTESPDGKSSWCIQCSKQNGKKWRDANPEQSRLKHLKKKYGIVEEDYEALFETQGGSCAICNTTEPGGPWSKFKVDHDHKTQLHLS